MPTSSLSVAVQHLLADVGSDGAGATDGELLARFVRSRDGDALAALVRRHAAMVWGVCRRHLAHHDAEDAFQATFLVLTRKAAGVPGGAVANWLYGVARQTAVRVRAAAAKRGRREAQVDMPEPTVPDERDDELPRLVDEEVSRLPDHYRGVIVLCDLEGMTRREAARQLGVPEGSVASRLARARAMLAKRLARRGVVFSGSVAALLGTGSAGTSAPPALVASTVEVASLLAAGQAAGVSVNVAVLTDGVVKAMFVSKLKGVLAAVLVLGFVATGGTFLLGLTAAGQDGKGPPEKKPMERAAKQDKAKAVEEVQKLLDEKAKKKAVEDIQKLLKDKEAVTAWGNEVGGLQAGLSFLPGERRAYHHGETVTLIVRVRNVGKEAAKFEYSSRFLDETPPTVTFADGKFTRQPKTTMLGIHTSAAVVLLAGEEVVLQTRTHGAAGKPYELWLPGEAAKPSVNSRLVVEAGKIAIQFEQVIGNSSAGFLNNPDPNLTKLATGKLELEIKAGPPPAATVPAAGPDKAKEKAIGEPQKLWKDDGKEAVTAWGKEVGGLQAGLGFPAGQSRVYYDGDTVRAVVRVRNTGKQEVTFQYLRSFFPENPLVITDANGKRVAQASVGDRPAGPAAAQAEAPLVVRLEPGKEVELTEAVFEVRRGISEGAWHGTLSPLHGPGTFSLQYGQVFGNSSLGKVKIDPDLLKLATGTLELEVKAGPPPAVIAPPPAAEPDKAKQKAVEEIQKLLNEKSVEEVQKLLEEMKKGREKPDDELLLGRWVVDAVSVEGRKQPKADWRFVAVTFAQDGGVRLMLPKGEEKGVYGINPLTAPKALDIIVDRGKGKETTRMIYKLHGDTLTIGEKTTIPGLPPNDFTDRFEIRTFILKRERGEQKGGADPSPPAPGTAPMPGREKAKGKAVEDTQKPPNDEAKEPTVLWNKVIGLLW